MGTIFLALPISSTTGIGIGFLNALFTSTSAVCVTGLIVIDTPSTFSAFGEVIIMTLIQIGGLGFLTFGVLIAIVLGKRIGIKERLLIQQSTNSLSTQGVVKLSLSIFFIAFIIEMVGAFILALSWMDEYGFARAFYYGVFHSISAFNNAGFALWSDSLSRYVGDPIVNLIIVFLFVSGGLGFTVILDLIRKRKWRDYSLNTKIVVSMTLFLMAFGILGIYLIEYFNPKTFGTLTTSDQLWAAVFQGIVPRTAGFNTIDIASMMTASQFLIIFLMFIGTSSGSTGGGIKTNTFAVLVLSVISIVSGKEDVHVFKRRIAKDLILRSLAVIIIALAIVLISTFLLTISEHNLKKDFMVLLFEATSAFGTVGLSMGLTPELSAAGKLIIIITMFIGRLGPLTLAFALAISVRKESFRYPEEKIMIG